MRSYARILSSFALSTLGALSIVLPTTSMLSTSVWAGQPEKPECVAPAKPGGGFDLTCRIALTTFDVTKTLTNPMRVTYLPGGVGAVAYNQFNSVRTSDGNAIVAFSTGSILNIAEGKWGEWTEKDARWVATAGTDYGAIVVRGDSPYKTFQDLMDAWKKNPSSIVVGAGGSVGGQDWMKVALLFRKAGLDPRKMRYVAFEGGGDAMANLLGGSIQVMPGDVGEMRSHLETGEMRVLAVLSPERLPAPFGSIPTAKEQGYDVEWGIVRGFYMGKHVSDEAYNTYVDAFRKIFATPEFRRIQEEQGLFPLEKSGDELAAYIHDQTAQMRALAKDAGLIQ
ncbi:Bug family tripartite tricarboxylate transporter substrate binding protein [Insolitispirillum peregrinum]|uniref:Bug family tripartite tricarboxylate transporter substrate binding protein n=1 Tax=Insolitispirillum peregrinum TaxID=80876 RepID=UPI003620FEAA